MIILATVFQHTRAQFPHSLSDKFLLQNYIFTLHSQKLIKIVFRNNTNNYLENLPDSDSTGYQWGSISNNKTKEGEQVKSLI